MPNTIEALDKLSKALDAASVAVEDAADKLANVEAPATEQSSTLVGGIETSDPKLIEAVLRVAHVSGQSVVIDYRDEAGYVTHGRKITPREFVGPAPYNPLSIIAVDEYRDGDTRRFRLSRIERVSC